MLRVVDVDYIKDYELLVTFSDGSKKKVDLKPYLTGEVFGELFFSASIILYIKYLSYIQKQFAYNLHKKTTACYIINLCSRSNLMQKLRS